MLHVLTGPDHLSALATLGSNAPPFQALWLGVRWGLGHSTGLILIGAIFIALTIDSDAESIQIPHAVSTFFESLVGVFMLCLGAYGFWRAQALRPKSLEEDNEAEEEVQPVLLELESQDRQDDDLQEDASRTHVDEELASGGAAEGECMPTMSIATDEMIMPETPSVEDDEEDTINDDATTSPTNCCSRVAQKISTGTMALLVGIIHGLAGPGGVLGVIPAVQLHDWRLASIYLGCFCFMSIITMGLFALVYGALSSKIGVNQHRQFLIQFIASGLSVLIGVLWLILLSIGKLDVVFP